ncbi:hypothetical protein ACH3XW_17760 [Acanthocheilonema viteae]
MDVTNEVRSTPTFNDDDWEAIFGTEDEVEDAREPSQSSGLDAKKPRQNDKSDNLAELVLTVNSEISTVYSWRAACTSANSISVGHSKIPSSVSVTPVAVYSEMQAQDPLLMIIMNLCMKREQKLRTEGSIAEANALSTISFPVTKLIAKGMELLRSNECMHVGSLILEAVKTSMNEGSVEWESLILCAESIYALVDEVRMKSADLNTKQQEMINKAEKKFDKEKHITKLANERKKRKLEAMYEKKQEEANEKRKCRVAQQAESQSIFHPQITSQAEHYMEAPNGGANAILIMAANKFRIRKDERRRQKVKGKSQINEERTCLLQSNVSDPSLQALPNLADDKSFTGPINAEVLMEEYAESDLINSVTLPTFLMQEDANYYCVQRPDFFASERAATEFHMSSHIRNDLPAIGEVVCSGLMNNIPNQSVTSLYPSTAIKISNPPQLDISSASAANLVREKNVFFVAENKYPVVELSNSPDSTMDIVDIIGFRDYRKKYRERSMTMPEMKKKKEMEKLPSREYDFFLEPNMWRPIGSINARSFCESCEFTRGDIRNWLIVGSRFDRLNGSIFNIKKSGCPKTHLSRVKYPPVHFRLIYDALTSISIKIAGLKIFLAIGEDWIVKKSIMPEEFTSFITKFADVLHKLYVKQYEVEHTKKVKLTEGLKKQKRAYDYVESGYAYVEMPTIILLTIPASNDPDAETKCNFYNKAIQELVQNWDLTWKSPYYHDATRQCIELKLIDWRQMCIDENANNNNDMIIILMKHLMEEWGVCMTPMNRS